MADTHPYISGAGNVIQAVNHLRNSFPPQITAETFKRLGIAPNNESFLINILRYIGAIDQDGKKTSAATSAFTKHQDEAFAKEFEKLVKNAYSDLFELHGDGAWELDTDDLITFFRSADETGATIGRRQAKVFEALAALSGHGELPTPTRAKVGGGAAKKTRRGGKKTAAKSGKAIDRRVTGDDQAANDVGLTVRVEINLPADGDQETYDRIFKSIRENLLNG